MEKLFLMPVILSSCFLCGCNKPSETTSKFDFVIITNRNATVYEINKANGEVLLISGAEYTRLKEKPPINQTNLPATEWTTSIAAQDGTNNANLGISFKHKWQNGQMYYVFTTDHYKDFFSQWMAFGAHASFELIFYDSDGFQKRSLNIDLSQSNLAEYNGNLILSENSSVPCSKDDYEDCKLWSVWWKGFNAPVSTTSLSSKLSSDPEADKIFQELETQRPNPY